jgi:hypothetical protein
MLKVSDNCVLQYKLNDFWTMSTVCYRTQQSRCSHYQHLQSSWPSKCCVFLILDNGHSAKIIQFGLWYRIFAWLLHTSKATGTKELYTHIHHAWVGKQRGGVCLLMLIVKAVTVTRKKCLVTTFSLRSYARACFAVSAVTAACFLVYHNIASTALTETKACTTLSSVS